MILRLDHLVLTCADLPATVAFYSRVMGFRGNERNGRWSLHFGAGAKADTAAGTSEGKINLHQRGREVEPHAMEPTPGSADLCFLTDKPMDWWLEHLLSEGVVIVEGPVAREGAQGRLQSVYFRDPDGNLLEVSRYDGPAA